MNGIPRTPLLLPSGQERVPTEMQVKALENLSEQVRSGEPINKGKALLDAGYSSSISEQPNRIFGSPTLIALMDEIGMGEEDLSKKHKELLNASRLDHMLFPTGPKEETGDPDKLSDEGIIELLASVNCTVRRIVHGETARHVYFWSADNKARKEALDMAYNLRGSYAPKKSQTTIGVFSMSDLRRKLKENSINIIQNDETI